MSITARWTEHSTPTLYIDCSKPLNTHDMQALPHLLHGAFIEANSRVDVMLDMTDSLPISQNLMFTLLNNIEPIAQELGQVVIIGVTATLETVLNTLNEIFHSFGEGLLFAETAAEADVLLAQFVPGQTPIIH